MPTERSLFPRGKIVACGDYASVRAAHPQAETRDLRGGYVLPGLIDTHVHFPQVRILGSFGYDLLDWLQRFTIPEEERLADHAYAQKIAHEFVQGLLSHGTTTALAFGSHFSAATAELFQAAQDTGLRLFSGLVLSDRNLSPKLHVSPDEAYRQSRDLIQRFHGRGRLRYSVMPRFALSTSEPMLRSLPDTAQGGRDTGLHFSHQRDLTRSSTGEAPVSLGRRLP